MTVPMKATALDISEATFRVYVAMAEMWIGGSLSAKTQKK